MMQPEKPVLIVELEKEMESIRGRLRLCEDALRELTECYEALSRKTHSS